MITGRRVPSLADIRALGLALAALWGLLGAAGALAETFMSVGDVSVDVTAKNAAAARDDAIAQAQAKAFDRLVKRLAPNPADQARLHPGQQEIERFVQDFTVQSERTSPVRYIGLFTVRFRASLVRKYLAESGIANVTDLQQVVVVPVYRGVSGASLWGQGNPWRAAWERGSLGDGPVTMILPNGDGFDTASLSAAAAQDGDMAAITSMMARYHAAGLVVAVAAPIDPAQGPAGGLSITISTYDGNGAKGSQIETVQPIPDELPEKTFLRGVSAAAAALQSGWRNSVGSSGSTGLVAPTAPDQTADLAGPAVTYPISMPIAALGDWVRLRDQLGGLTGVQRLSLDVVTRDGVAFTLDYAGDPIALQSALAGGGYALVQLTPANAGAGIFQLRRLGAAAGSQ